MKTKGLIVSVEWKQDKYLLVSVYVNEKWHDHNCTQKLVSLFPVSNKIVWEMFGFARAIKSEV